MTGNKEKLLAKLAKLTAQEYNSNKDQLDGYFSKNRFIRTSRVPTKAEEIPILKESLYVRNLLLTVYAVKHLRGNTILEPDHDNNTYTTEELANALLHRRVELKGGFLKVSG